MSSEKPQIALVDASPDICQLTATSFEQLGCDVRCWRDGATAWRDLQHWRPQIAIIDLDLDGMDGLELGRRLREFYQQRLLLIATSCIDRTMISDDVRRCGFEELVVKPYTIEDLIAGMECAVALSQGQLRRVA